MKILIFGKDGQLGKAFKKILLDKDVIFVGRQECDLSNSKSIGIGPSSTLITFVAPLGKETGALMRDVGPDITVMGLVPSIVNVAAPVPKSIVPPCMVS